VTATGGETVTFTSTHMVGLFALGKTVKSGMTNPNRESGSNSASRLLKSGRHGPEDFAKPFTNDEVRGTGIWQEGEITASRVQVIEITPACTYFRPIKGAITNETKEYSPSSECSPVPNKKS